MIDETEGSSWGPDVNHWLITLRPDLERRLNRMVKELKKLDAEADAARVQLLTIEITPLIFQVFAACGEGVTRGLDDTFLNLSEEAIEKYDLSWGKPFSHFFRFLYARRIYNPVTVSERFNDGALSLDEYQESNGDSGYARLSHNEWEEISDFTPRTEDDSRSVIIAHDDEATEAEFARFLALIVGFFEHVPDKRDYTDEKKLYIRLFFTEAITRMVKIQVLIDDCVPFEQHEQEIFSSLELPFQDAYMVNPCRTVRVIWLTDLKTGHKPITPGDFTWKLSNGFIRQYLAEAYDRDVTDSAISQQRKNFRKFVAKCGLADKEKSVQTS